MSNEELKKRALAAKSELPPQITSLFFHYYKNVIERNKKNISRLNNVLQLRTVDRGLIEKLEELSELVKPKLINK